MKEQIDELYRWRFIPDIQRHEFEAIDSAKNLKMLTKT